jgi:hypothetical protein
MHAFTRSSAIRNAAQRTKLRPPRINSTAGPFIRAVATPAENMTATAKAPYRVHILPGDSGLYKIQQTEDAAKRASELLQTDLEVWRYFS